MSLVKHASLRNLLEFFPTESLSYVFGYGSGVFPQKNQKPGKMIDLIFVVDDSRLWHKENLEMNPAHYSFLKRFGSRAISKIQEGFASGVYYNPFVSLNGQMVKYGVISTSALNDDLVNWRHMYIAGRLQKPVQDIKPPTSSTIINNMKKNRMAALRAVLLQLPPYTTRYELYYGITALSYIGDFRMYVGEHPNKIKNIVVPLMKEFDKIYLPLVESLEPFVSVDKQKDRIIQRNTMETKVGHLMALPVPVQIRLAQKHKYNLSHYDIEEVMFNLSAKRHIDKAVIQTMSSIVASSSISQTLQGVLTAGLVKSIWYGFEKIMKKFTSSGSGSSNKEKETTQDPRHVLSRLEIAEIELEQADIMEAEAEIADALRIAVLRTTFSSATALLHAVLIGDMEHIRLMDENGTDWCVKDENRCNVIHFAVSGGNPETLKFVLTRLGDGAINEKDVHGWSPLLRAVALCENSEMIKVLLENGADPNSSDHDNSRSCLFIASMMGKAEIVKLLLAHKADPFYGNAYGRTPLRMAYTLKRNECIDLLISSMKALNPNANVQPPSHDITARVNGLGKEVTAPVTQKTDWTPTVSNKNRLPSSSSNTDKIPAATAAEDSEEKKSVSEQLMAAEKKKSAT